jgi:hypothetical protein
MNLNLPLKAKIIEKFGSQANFSEVINEPEPAISRTIRGRRKLDEQGRSKWAEALDCEADEIFISKAE